MTSPPDPRDDERNPLELLLDIGVYAPLGFALEFRRLVPELAEAGRRQIDFSRSLGRTALRTMARSAAGAPPAAARRTASPSPSTPDTPEIAVSPSAEMPGYDEMTAKDAIAAVAGATPQQLVWIRRRENADKRRKTVLAAIERATDG